AGIRFGVGWFRAEKEGNERFRWGTENAILEVRGPKEAGRTVKLVLGPGPGVDWLPFELTVHDEENRVVAQGMVRWRQELHLALPLQPGKTHQFRLTAKGTGFPTARDWPVLYFRAYGCGWSNEGKRIRALPPSRTALNMVAISPPEGSGWVYQ